MYNQLGTVRFFHRNRERLVMNISRYTFTSEIGIWYSENK
jgi:hypothetical protein